MAAPTLPSGLTIVGPGRPDGFVPNLRTSELEPFRWFTGSFEPSGALHKQHTTDTPMPHALEDAIDKAQIAEPPMMFAQHYERALTDVERLTESERKVGRLSLATVLTPRNLASAHGIAAEARYHIDAIDVVKRLEETGGMGNCVARGPCWTGRTRRERVQWPAPKTCLRRLLFSIHCRALLPRDRLFSSCSSRNCYNPWHHYVAQSQRYKRRMHVPEAPQTPPLAQSDEQPADNDDSDDTPGGLLSQYYPIDARLRTFRGDRYPEETVMFNTDERTLLCHLTKEEMQDRRRRRDPLRVTLRHELLRGISMTATTTTTTEKGGSEG